MSKKYINIAVGLSLVVFLSMGGHSQSVFSIFRATRLARTAKAAEAGRALVVCREMQATNKSLQLAKNVAKLQSAKNLQVEKLAASYLATKEAKELECVLNYKIKYNFKVVVQDPNNLWGSYNYLRKIPSAIVSKEILVGEQYVKTWSKIRQATGYNGVHHIVTKNTLELIYNESKVLNKRLGIRLEEMQANAPAMFHPYHGNSRYANVFHNPQEQLFIYKHEGISGVLQDAFTKLDYINKQHGLPPLTDAFKQGTIEEAKLWCKTFNLMW